MKTKAPLNFYFIILATIGSIILLLYRPFFQIAFYAVFIFLYLYVFLGRDSCKLEIRDNTLLVNYIYPWEKDIAIDLFKVIDVDYEKGFYDLFSDKTRGGLFVFPKYCSDRLILKMKVDDEVDTVFVPINTRIFEFNKIVKHLKSNLSNNK